MPAYPKGVCVITMDDTYAGQKWLINHLLTRGWRGTIYPVIEGFRYAEAGDASYLHPDDARAAVENGWEVGVHCTSYAAHAGYASIGAEGAAKDLEACRAWLIKNGFPNPETMAYPLGRCNDGQADGVRGRIASARTITSTASISDTAVPQDLLRIKSRSGVSSNGGPTDPSQAWWDRAAATGSLVVLTVHDVTTGASTNVNQAASSQLTTLFDSIAASGMAVRTMREVTHQILNRP